MLRSFDPRSGAHVPRRRRPLLRHPRRLRGRRSPSSTRRCPACTSGSTISWPSGDGGLMMRRLTFLLRPQWLALFVVVIAFAYLCFTVLAPWQLGKNTKTSRENAQIAASLDADPVPLTTLLPQQDSSAPDRAVAARHGDRAATCPTAQVLARLRVDRRRTRRSRCWCRSPSTAARPCSSTAATSSPCKAPQVPRVRAAADGHRDDHRPVARLRSRRCRARHPFRAGRCPAGVLDQHRADLRADRCSAGRVLSAAGRRPARRARRDPAAASRRRAVPVLRHPVDRVRHHRADRRWATSSSPR